MGDLLFELEENTGYYVSRAYSDETDALVCTCKISYNKDNVWTISSWYAVPGFGNKGYGTRTMKQCVLALYEDFGLPKSVEYIWNGTNQYVFDWMERHFGAISKCPIAVQKYANDDDWESHEYVLNMDKFLEYFEVLNGRYT